MENIFYIIVPVFNTESYVAKCIESVLRQTYKKYNIIIVDDGSTDSSLRICKDYENKYSSIHVLHQENQGQLASRLNAIKYAKDILISKEESSYFFFLDSDDLLPATALELVNKKIKKHNPDCLVFNWSVFSDEKDLSDEKNINSKDYLIIDKKDLYLKVFSESSYNSLCRKVIKTTLMDIEDLSKYYYIRKGEDLIQSLNIYKSGVSFLFTDAVCYFYRKNMQSVTHVVTDLDKEIDFTVRQMVLDFLNEENVFTKEYYLKYFASCNNLILDLVKVIVRNANNKRNVQKYIEQVLYSDYFRNVSVQYTRIKCTSLVKTIFLKGIYNKFTRKIFINLLCFIYKYY